jgi:hypothetical protein
MRPRHAGDEPQLTSLSGGGWRGWRVSKYGRKLNALAFGGVSKDEKDTFMSYKLRVGKFFGVDSNQWELHSASPLTSPLLGLARAPMGPQQLTR